MKKLILIEDRKRFMNAIVISNENIVPEYSETHPLDYRLCDEIGYNYFLKDFIELYNAILGYLKLNNFNYSEEFYVDYKNKYLDEALELVEEDEIDNLILMDPKEFFERYYDNFNILSDEYGMDYRLFFTENNAVPKKQLHSSMNF